LKQFRELTSLTTLDLSGTQVTDVGLRELEELKNLKCLDLGNTKITDPWAARSQAAQKLDDAGPRRQQPYGCGHEGAEKGSAAPEHPLTNAANSYGEII
jgi:Leucine Rich repeats (2 copies)